ncbi:FAD-dependent oxidoreductase [Mycobacterium heidelbergense]|uniref:FAD-dependent oxidoreductase n=1 Tax=Mycobacterium heidelbergense TaxID=53376 RepID=A0A1X0DF19_MYCHE|nr:FAD-dependent oxidoreductase [Mycobacterium heidelbergense]MCV7053196.1 FAD-dependent oxidoreductase [Mycobacterium heidelbergense]ORA70981.1 FAD-dependent oxidoreductase [Mycobacterium heidelbergense]BBZ52506.1 reductase [Mycobacterium heidelbergense]
MASSTTFVIVGGGLAGAKAVEALRDNDFDGQIILFADEKHLPYERPPLSKEYLAGKKSLADFTVQDSGWYRDHDVDLRLGSRVSSLDPNAHTVGLPDDTTVAYDRLLLATGSASRRPPLPGSDADGVHYLRTYDDAVELNSVLTEGSSLAVVGAGWIGLEVAAGARQRGVNVTVVETAKQPLLAALGETVGEVFADLHREHGVDLRLEAQVEEITTTDGRATGLKMRDGSTVAADAVLVAVGARPNIELAERAGLATGDGGVLVDASLRTSDPDVYAVGDIAAAEHPLFGTRIRTEHWANALKQPAVAAAGMLGAPGEYAELPYFFTDQYDLGMEYVGHAPAFERVVFRGDVSGREFVAFWLDGHDRVLAGMNVNVWDVLDDVKALIRSKAPVDVDALTDPRAPLADLPG